MDRTYEVDGDRVISRQIRLEFDRQEAEALQLTIELRLKLIYGDSVNCWQVRLAIVRQETIALPLAPELRLKN